MATKKDFGIVTTVRVIDSAKNVILNKDTGKFEKYGQYEALNEILKKNQISVSLCVTDKQFPIEIGLDADGKYIGFKLGRIGTLGNGGQDYPTGIKCPPIPDPEEICDQGYKPQCRKNEVWCIWKVS